MQGDTQIVTGQERANRDGYCAVWDVNSGKELLRLGKKGTLTINSIAASAVREIPIMISENELYI